jgi:hypothetical protein
MVMKRVNLIVEIAFDVPDHVDLPDDLCTENLRSELRSVSGPIIKEAIWVSTATLDVIK